jgi:hypothetical protein
VFIKELEYDVIQKMTANQINEILLNRNIIAYEASKSPEKEIKVCAIPINDKDHYKFLMANRQASEEIAQSGSIH